MNKRKLSLIWLFLHILYTSVPAQDGKQTSITSPVNLKPAKTWAVVIGIAKYKNIQSLDYADRDAQAFYNYLVNTDGGPKLNAAQVKLLVNEKALSNEIYGALDWLSESVKENDKVVFYFSGHGDVEKKTSNQDGFLLAYNSPRAAYATSGTVSIANLQKYLNNYVSINKVKEVVLIADACRSGMLAGGIEGVQLTRQALGQNPNDHIVSILSAQENELSLEGTKWGGGRGVFSYYLIKGLEGLADRNSDSLINTAELADYLTFSIADATGNTQHPEIDGNPKQELFSFNEKLISAANEDANINLQQIVDFGDGIADDLQPDVKTSYRKYLDYIRQGKLIWGENEKDTINCAKYVYLQLYNKPGVESIQASLRSCFIAALQRRSQDLLDDYLKGAKVVFGLDEATKELFYLQGIIVPGYILYNYIIARVNFLRSYSSPLNRIPLLKKSQGFEEDAPYTLDELGDAFHAKGLDDSAMYYYQKAASVAPKWSAPYIGIGLVYSSIKASDQAIKAYEKAILLDSIDLMAYNNLGTEYQNRGDFQKALVYYKKALNLNFGYGTEVLIYNFKTIYSSLGATYQHLNDYQNAAINYEAAISLGLTDSKVYYNLGRLYQDKNDLNESMIKYQKAIQLDSLYKDAYNNLGVIYELQKDYNNAITNFKKAISIDSTYADAYDNLGVTYAYIKEFKKGVECLQKARSLTPDNIIVYYNLTCAYSIWNHTGESLGFLKQTLQKGFTDYNQIMQDEDLINLRKTDGFTALMKQYFPDKFQ